MRICLFSLLFNFCWLQQQNVQQNKRYSNKPTNFKGFTQVAPFCIYCLSNSIILIIDYKLNWSHRLRKCLYYYLQFAMPFQYEIRPIEKPVIPPIDLPLYTKTFKGFANKVAIPEGVCVRYTWFEVQQQSNDYSTPLYIETDPSKVSTLYSLISHFITRILRYCRLKYLTWQHFNCIELPRLFFKGNANRVFIS